MNRHRRRFPRLSLPWGANQIRDVQFCTDKFIFHVDTEGGEVFYAVPSVCIT
jgi:hypothetical protein